MSSFCADSTVRSASCHCIAIPGPWSRYFFIESTQEGQAVVFVLCGFLDQAVENALDLLAA
jgi:hypothetical protein